MVISTFLYDDDDATGPPQSNRLLGLTDSSGPSPLYERLRRWGPAQVQYRHTRPHVAAALVRGFSERNAVNRVLVNCNRFLGFNSSCADLSANMF